MKHDFFLYTFFSNYQNFRGNIATNKAEFIFIELGSNTPRRKFCLIELIRLVGFHFSKAVLINLSITFRVSSSATGAKPLKAFHSPWQQSIKREKFDDLSFSYKDAESKMYTPKILRKINFIVVIRIDGMIMI